MKPFSNIIFFVLTFGFLSFFSWSLYTILISQMPNIERAFGLSSWESGWLLTIWELGYVVCTLFTSFYASRAHVPRVIGIFTIVCGLSGFVFALPHFVAFKDPNTGANTINGTFDDMANIDLCVRNRVIGNESAKYEVEDEAENAKDFSRKTLAFTLFNLGMMLQGVGKAPCYPYSGKYVDDNGEKRKTGFYVGIMSSIAIFGLALGYGIGSIVSNIYVTLEHTELESTDTRYIGAWWLAIVSISVTVLLIAVPMFWFPRLMKQTQQVTEPPRDLKRKSTTVKSEMKRFFTTIVLILKSPVYTITIIASCLQVISFSCFMGFEPKYMTTQFSITPWKVNIILGASSILAYSFGCLIAGFFTKKWEMTPFRCILMMITLFTSVTICIVINTFLGCEQQDVYNTPSSLSGQPSNLDCDCSKSEFVPICGDDGRSYFSPCHAGCIDGTPKTFANCSAIPEGGAKIGMCPTDCGTVWWYTAVKFTMNLIDAMASIPTFLVFLRAAEDEHKALALGVSAFVISLAGWMTGPIIGGKIVDSTCIFWNTASTSTKYCSFYNIESLRYRLHGLMIGLRIASICLLSLALFKARKMSHWISDRKEEAEDVKDGQPMIHPGEIIENHD